MQEIDVGAMQTAALALALTASVIALASMVLGLYSALTGKDHWPQQAGRIRGRVPASAEDQRAHGLSMVLNGCGALLILLAVTLTTVSIGSRAGEPMNTMQFLIDLIALIAALASVIGAHSFGSRVKYVHLHRGWPAKEGRQT